MGYGGAVGLCNAVLQRIGIQKIIDRDERPYSSAALPLRDQLLGKIMCKTSKRLNSVMPFNYIENKLLYQCPRISGNIGGKNTENQQCDSRKLKVEYSNEVK